MAIQLTTMCKAEAQKTHFICLFSSIPYTARELFYFLYNSYGIKCIYSDKKCSHLKLSSQISLYDVDRNCFAQWKSLLRKVLRSQIDSFLHFNNKGGISFKGKTLSKYFTAFPSAHPGTAVLINIMSEINTPDENGKAIICVENFLMKAARGAIHGYMYICIYYTII